MAIRTILLGSNGGRYVVDLESERDLGWGEGSIVFCKDTNKMYTLIGTTWQEAGAAAIDAHLAAFNHSLIGQGGAAWGGITGTLSAQTDLNSALAGKSDTGHTHPAAGYHFVGTLAADQATGANVTPVTLSGLVFSYEANSKYRLWFMGRVAPTAATTGCGFQFDLSSAVTAISVLFSHQLANTGTLSGGHSIADDASVGVSSGLPGTSTYPVVGNGLLVTGANTGTAQLRFRSETTAVTTCKAGLTLVVEKVA